jgi:hypothetical protein
LPMLLRRLLWLPLLIVHDSPTYYMNTISDLLIGQF